MSNLPMLPTQEEYSQIKDIALVAVKSGLLPYAIKTPEAAVIIALKGRELGLPPMVAFSHINVIQGKATMSAEIMLAYIRKDFPKADIQFVESTDKVCKIKAKRPDDKEYTIFEMTFEQAYNSGFAKSYDKDKKEWTVKDNWAKQPKTMLRWRVISEMKRFLFSEVLMGIDYTPEEIEEVFEQTPIKDITPVKEEKKLEPKKLKNYAPQAIEEIKKDQIKTIEEPMVEEIKEESSLPSRDEMAKQIVSLAKKIDSSGWASYMKETISKHFDGKSSQDLTDIEMMDLILFLESQLKQKGEKK